MRLAAAGRGSPDSRAGRPMRRLWVVPVALLLIAPAAQAQPEFHSLRLAFGVGWPERQPREFSADDRVSFHYVVDRVRRDGRELDCAIRITNAAGDTV